jgi:predicted nucleic acid-binding protein
MTDRARALLADSLRRQRPILGPPHLASEVASALYQRNRSTDPARHITDDEADRAMQQFLATPLVLTAPDDLYTEAITFARTHGIRSIYDSLYVVMARLTTTELWTADERLLTALGGRAPWVRSLADYPV